MCKRRHTMPHHKSQCNWAHTLTHAHVVYEWKFPWNQKVYNVCFWMHFCVSLAQFNDVGLHSHWVNMYNSYVLINTDLSVWMHIHTHSTVYVCVCTCAQIWKKLNTYLLAKGIARNWNARVHLSIHKVIGR